MRRVCSSLWLGLAACQPSTPPTASSPEARAVPGPAQDAAVERPTPADGAVRVPLLHPPFAADWRTNNPFDHEGKPTSRVGPVLDWRGVPMLGTSGHRAWDFDLPVGTPVLAPADGVVRVAGQVPPFRCAELGREVSDQIAVVLQHASPDGQVIETSFDHLSAVGVKVGDVVTQGQHIADSGNTGCSLGAHLHFGLYLVQDDRRVPMDPFGWEGPYADPWSTRAQAPSTWWWAEAPRLWFETRRAPDATEGTPKLAVLAARYAAFRDDRSRNNERIELVVDPHSAHDGPVSLEGWQVVAPRGAPFVFPAGTQAVRGEVLTLLGGAGRDSAEVLHWSSPVELLPDPGGVVRVLDPQGNEVHQLAYGLGRPDLAPEAVEPPSCPSSSVGCVPLPAPGPVRELAWSPTGERLALTVGEARRLVLREASGDSQLVWPVGASTREVQGVSRLRWVSPELLTFNQPRRDGSLEVGVVVPGMLAGPAFSAAEDRRFQLQDAADGELVMSRWLQGVPHFVRWRIGQLQVTPFTRTTSLEDDARRAPDGAHTAFRDRNRLVRVDMATGARQRVLSRAPEHFAWLGDDLVVVRGGVLGRPADNDITPWMSGIDGSVFAVDPGASAVVVLGEDGLLRVVDARGRTVAEHDPAGRPEQVALVWSGTGWRLAWFVPEGGGVNTGLFVAEVPVGGH